MTPIFIHLSINGKHKGKKLVGLTECNDSEWRFLYVNSETDEDVLSDKAYPNKQAAIAAATNSEANPIAFTEQWDAKIKAPKMDVADARTAGQAFDIYRQQHEPRHGDTGTFTDLDGIKMAWGCFNSGDSQFRFQFRAWVQETGDYTLIKYFI